MMNYQPYEPPHAEDVRSKSAPSFVLAVTAIGVAVLVEILLIAASYLWAFERIFSRMGVTGIPIGPTLRFLLLVIIIASIAKEFVPKLRGIANIWNVVVLLVALSCIPIYIVATIAKALSLGDYISS